MSTDKAGAITRTFWRAHNARAAEHRENLAQRRRITLAFMPLTRGTLEFGAACNKMAERTDRLFR
jgi:hypothetical protein